MYYNRYYWLPKWMEIASFVLLAVLLSLNMVAAFAVVKDSLEYWCVRYTESGVLALALGVAAARTVWRFMERE